MKRIAAYSQYNDGRDPLIVDEFGLVCQSVVKSDSSGGQIYGVLIGVQVRCQNLQGDFAIELCVLSQIYLIYSALADFRADFVTAETCARSNRQEVFSNIKSLRQTDAPHQVRKSRV